MSKDLFEKVFVVLSNVLKERNTHIPGHKSWKEYFETFIPMSDILIGELLPLSHRRDWRGPRIVNKYRHKGIKLSY